MKHKILKYLQNNPTIPSSPQIAKEVGITKQGVRYWIKILINEGLLKKVGLRDWALTRKGKI